MAHCFYCSKPVIREVSQKAHNRITTDHIYPRSRGKPRGMVIEKWETMNLVDCCRECNAYKGSISPIDWLVIMRSPTRAKALAERIVAMGEPIGEVFDAMRRRRIK